MKCGLFGRFEAFVKTLWAPPDAHCSYAQGMRETRGFGSTFCVTADKNALEQSESFPSHNNVVESHCWRSCVLKLLFCHQPSCSGEIFRAGGSLWGMMWVCWEGDSSVTKHCSPHSSATLLCVTSPCHFCSPCRKLMWVLGTILIFCIFIVFILKVGQNLLVASCLLFTRSESIIASWLSSATNASWNYYSV